MANMDISRRQSMDTMPAALAVAFGSPASGDSLHHDLQGVVARALRTARASGRDYLGQTEAAARAVVSVRPDLTLSQAMVAVNWLRDHVD